MNLTQKILKNHLLKGELVPGEEIAIRIDQTLTQDSTGTMAYLQLEAMGVDRVKTERSMAYIDHNTLQTGFENADDHQYITTVAKKHGIYLSKPGNGICHQVQLERVGKPGRTLLGSDSHTPTGGALGMLAIGAGGLDVAVAMGGGAYYLNCPKVVNVHLTGKLPRGVAAKDVILELLRRLTVKGGVGKVMEYTGEGVESLTIPERATIANMGAELGATTSVFPSDEAARRFLKAQEREEDYQPLFADPDAEYDEEVDIDLSKLEPMVALPHMPDNVKTVREAGPGAASFAETTGLIPCNQKYLDDNSATDETIKAFNEQIQYCVPMVKIIEGNQTWDPMHAAMGSLATGADPKTALDTAVQQIKDNIAALHADS